MSPNGRGRILLISYHYGPNCETGGFRWTAMVPDLVAAGWSFDVITLARPAHRPPPHSSRAPAADAVEVFTLPAVAWPESLIEVLVGRARSALPSPRRPEHGNGTRPESVSLDDVAVWSPDTSVPLRSRLARLVYGTAQELSAWLWARRAAKLGRRLARHRDYDAVIVSTPPNLHHLAGVWISRRTGIPYIADYRDPWIAGLGPLESYYTPAYRAAGRIWERRSQRSARLVIHNTPRAMREAAAAYGRVSERTAIPNGYEPGAPADEPDADTFIVALTGWVHPFMDLRVLFRACSRFLDRTPGAREHFRLHLMGTPETFGGVPVGAMAAAAGLGDLVVWESRASRAEALRLQQRAAVLAAFDWLHDAAVVMKFYDYVQMRGALLLIGSPAGALAEAAGRMNIPVIAPGDDAGIDRVLDTAYRRWRQRDYGKPNDADGIFQRRHRSRELDAALLHTVGRSGSIGHPDVRASTQPAGRRP